MTRTSLIAAAAILAAAPAVAGNVEPVIVEQPLIIADPAPLVDWSGGYAGVAAVGYDFDGTVGGVAFDDDAAGGGAFLGTNFQNGNIVYGGELGLGTGGDVDYAVDLRGRVGYAAGRALPYLTVGYAFVEADNGDDIEGPTYGLGVDYLVTDRVFVGAEYRRLDLEGGATDLDTDAFGLRVGFRF